MAGVSGRCWGPVELRTATREWQPFFAVSLPNGLALYRDEEERGKPEHMFFADPGTTAHALVHCGRRPWALELMAGGTEEVVLALGSEADRDRWVAALDFVARHQRREGETQRLATSGDLTMDKIVAAARLQCAHDEIYFFRKEQREKLGIDLIRTEEWVVVLGSQQPEVERGSVLHSINGQPTALLPYADTMQRLMSADWPLTLGFKRPPVKRGTLRVKLQDGRDKLWHRRSCELRQGALVYFSLTNATQVVGQIPLANVSLTPTVLPDQGDALVVGHWPAGVLLQCDSSVELLEWAAAIYHSIAMSNGGYYLLEHEAREAWEGLRRANRDPVETDHAHERFLAEEMAELRRSTAETTVARKRGASIRLGKGPQALTDALAQDARPTANASALMATLPEQPVVPAVERHGEPTESQTMAAKVNRRRSLGQFARQLNHADLSALPQMPVIESDSEEEEALGDGEAAEAGAEAVPEMAARPASTRKRPQSRRTSTMLPANLVQAAMAGGTLDASTVQAAALVGGAAAAAASRAGRS